MTKTRKQANNHHNKGSVNRLAFLKYYLNETLDGSKNLCFGKVNKAARKAGYSESYAKKVLSRIAEQQNEEGERVRKVHKSLRNALDERKLDTDWIANLVERLGQKNERRLVNRKLVDTGDPDTSAAKIVLDFIARTQGLYDSEAGFDKFEGWTKDQLVDYILESIAGNGR